MRRKYLSFSLCLIPLEFKNSYWIQLILEQHGFELYGSTYMLIFFPINITVPHNLASVESKGAEVWKWGADSNFYVGISTAERVGTPKSTLFKSQLCSYFYGNQIICINSITIYSPYNRTQLETLFYYKALPKMSLLGRCI